MNTQRKSDARITQRTLRLHRLGRDEKLRLVADWARRLDEDCLNELVDQLHRYPTRYCRTRAYNDPRTR